MELVHVDWKDWVELYSLLRKALQDELNLNLIKIKFKKSGLSHCDSILPFTINS